MPFVSAEEPFCFEDLAILNTPLPAQLQALKGAGRFTALRRAITARLADGWPAEQLRRRLVLELHILDRLEADYTLTRDDVVTQLDALADGLTPSLLDEYEAKGLVDWLLIEGEVRYLNSTVDNLLRIAPQLHRRPWPDEQRAKDEEAEKRELPRIMMRDGQLAMRYRMRCRVRVRPEYVREGCTVRVQLPLPIRTAQVEDVSLLHTSHTPTLVAPEDHPQRSVLIEKPLARNDVFEIEYSYTVRNLYRDVYTLADADEAARAAAAAGLPAKVLTEADRQRYLAEQPSHIAFTPALRTLAASIVGDETDPLRKARAIYDRICADLRYSYSRSYFATPDLSEAAAFNQRGDCGMMALLFITLCRICGIPARWQAGRTILPCSNSTGCHDWAMFYIEPFGWLWADCSYGVSARAAGDEERRRFYFGNTVPARLVLASEFSSPFAAPMRYLRFDPYDNQSGEAEYTDRGIPYGGLDCETVILEKERID